MGVMEQHERDCTGVGVGIEVYDKKKARGDESPERALCALGGGLHSNLYIESLLEASVSVQGVCPRTAALKCHSGPIKYKMTLNRINLTETDLKISLRLR